MQDTGNTLFDMGRNLAGTQVVNANAQTHNLTFENPLGAAAASACGVPTPPYVCVSTPKILANDFSRRTPYVEQYELNIQHTLNAHKDSFRYATISARVRIVTTAAFYGRVRIV